MAGKNIKEKAKQKNIYLRDGNIKNIYKKFKEKIAKGQRTETIYKTLKEKIVKRWRTKKIMSLLSQS